MQVTVHLPIRCFRVQNFNVLAADFEQSHVDGIVSKVVQNRDDLIVLFQVMRRVNHLNINDNARSTQV